MRCTRTGLALLGPPAVTCPDPIPDSSYRAITSTELAWEIPSKPIRCGASDPSIVNGLHAQALRIYAAFETRNSMLSKPGLSSCPYRNYMAKGSCNMRRVMPFSSAGEKKYG